MATTDTLFTIIPADFKHSIPNTARYEMQANPDAASATPLLATSKRGVLVFPKDSPVNPDAFVEFIIPKIYANTTGITINIAYATQPPLTGSNGNVVWEGAIEVLTSDLATSLWQQDTFGTPVTATDTPSTTAGRIKTVAIVIPKANAGGGAGAGLQAGTVLQAARVRIRRLNTNAADTLNGAVYLLNADIRET